MRPMPLPPLDSPKWNSSFRAFAQGFKSVSATIFAAVLFATYIGIGALAHDSHFSLGWTLLSTILVWAGPAQIIVITTLGSGATILQSAIAVTVSAIRLFPMVASVIPLMRTPETKKRHLILVAHLTAVTLWVECHRFLPQVPRSPDHLRSRARLRPVVHHAVRQHDRLFSRCQSLPDPRCRYPAADAARLSVLDRPQLQRAVGRCGAGAGPSALPAVLSAEHRPRHNHQRRGGRHNRLWCSSREGARMSDFIGDWHALAVLLVAGVIPNQIWRMLGLWLGGGLDEGSELLIWVRAVATAILAGVIAQILVQPPGALASVPALLRYGALAAGFIAFMLTRRSIFAGVLAGEIVMLAGQWWL